MIGGVALVLFSSVAQTMRMQAVRQKRHDSEGARLVTYVKYLSETPVTPGTPSDVPE